jgi:hypothetical protein
VVGVEGGRRLSLAPLTTGIKVIREVSRFVFESIRRHSSRRAVRRSTVVMDRYHSSIQHRSSMSWAKLNQSALPIRIHIHLPGRVMMVEGGEGMGDKGGKKDKEKNKQRQLTKHKQQEREKQDKARPKTA